MTSTSPREGLSVARLFMVLSSLSPLFLLWAIRGQTLVPDHYFIPVCAGLAILPNLFLLRRVEIAKCENDRREKVIGSAEDNRDHILVYLFAMLLPFYSEDLSSPRTFAATIAALVFIVFLFWHLNLHYMNIVFALQGRRVFTVYSPEDQNPHTGRSSFALITRRSRVCPGDRVTAIRLSETVYLEEEES